MEVLICVVYFIIGFVVAGVCKAEEFIDVMLAALFWPILLALGALVILATFSFNLGEKFSDKLGDKLRKLIFWEKKQ